MKKYIATVAVAILTAVNLYSQNCLDTTTYTGSATYYNYAGGGYCSFPVPEAPIYSVAMSAALYDTAATCGTCLEITGSLGSVVASVEDQCPSCASNSLDLSEEAFSQIEDVLVGTASIQWKYIACPVMGNIALYISNGSNPYYIQVQVRNHRYPVKSVEFKDTGNQYTLMQRGMDNFFTISPTVTPANGPFIFRITDILNNVIEETGVPLAAATEIQGNSQFPLCEPVTGINKIIERNDGFNIFPNPTNSSFINFANNTTTEVSYYITDLLGRKISEGIVLSLSPSNIAIHENGMFLVYYQFSNGYKNIKKVLVQ